MDLPGPTLQALKQLTAGTPLTAQRLSYTFTRDPPRRALRRAVGILEGLVRRGLARRDDDGYRITPEGRKAARAK